ncbi:hypothetical protein ACFP2T_22525 [Plantactinospora solaniradicis]|uniref:Abi-like protein n=1 Tax=Plantactinospora solaniradicis TaxID=1723736 RepID=A0ABW1KBE3_9ACTN
MTTDLPPWMRRAFSPARLAPYLAACGGDPATAERLYWWNSEVSAAFLGPLHCLEVTLRNALHQQLHSRFGRADWWTAAPLNAVGRRLVGEAEAKFLRRSPVRQITSDDIVAQLSFGFWVSLLSNSRGSSYDRHLWVPTLHRAFPHYSGRRALLHDNFESMRLLRNRIMHYEPIHHRDLLADHTKLYRLLNYVDAVAAKEVAAMDRVPTVLRQRADACAGRRHPRF